MKEELKNGIVITITVLLILVIVYFATAIFMTGEIGNKNKKEDNQQEKASNNEDSYENMIIASSTFKQKEAEYMVMFFSKNDVSENLKNALKNYDSVSKQKKLYIVNMDEAINKYVKGKEINSSATSAEELKINGNTLLVVQNGIIKSYYTDEDEIVSNLK